MTVADSRLADAPPPDALLFVYNADEGLAAALFDAGHKMLSPATYQCSLCAITYGAVAMKRAWRDWLKAQPFEARFHHRQDFARAWPAWRDLALPAVLAERDGQLSLLLSAEALDALPDIAALVAAIEGALAAQGVLRDSRLRPPDSAPL